MYARIHDFIRRHLQIIKFVIVGGTSATTSAVILFVLTHFLHVWYIFSAIIAFLFAFFVSFFLQKFWTFGDHSMRFIIKQLMSYGLVILVNLFLNTLFLYVLVEFAHMYYVLAQIVVGGVISLASYFLYQRYSFTTRD